MNRGWIHCGPDKLTYRKEAIPLGDYGKLDSQGKGMEFSAEQETLDHWAASVPLLRRNGVRIPFAKSHDTWQASEDHLGEIVAAHVMKNKSGVPSLFLDIKFDDEASRDVALRSDISIGSPPVWFDGRKRKYTYPLQHVASTSAPVIPGLETWEAIAASHRKEISMATETTAEFDISKLQPATLKALATDAGIPAQLRQLAKAQLAEADDEPEQTEEGAAIEEAIAASHASGGFAAWAEKFNARNK